MSRSAVNPRSINANESGPSLRRSLLHAVTPLILGGGLSLCISLVAVRAFGATVYGEFAVCLSVAGLVRTASLLGLDRAIVPTVARFRIEKRFDLARRTLIRCNGLVALFALAVSAVAIPNADAIVRWLRLPHGAQGAFGLAVLLGVSSAGIALASGYALGLHRFRTLIGARQIVVKGGQLCALGVLAGVASVTGIELSLVMLVGVWFLADIIGAAIIIRASGLEAAERSDGVDVAIGSERSGGDTNFFRDRELLVAGVPIALQVFVSDLSAHGSILLLAHFGTSPDDIAAYSIAIQVVGLAMFVFPTVIQAFTAHAAHAIAVSNLTELQSGYSVVWALGAIPALGAVGACVAGGPLLLTPWGLNNPNLWGPLVGVALVQLADVVLGPTGTVLVAGRRSRALLLGAIASGIMFLLGAMLAIPVWGMIGAIATLGASHTARHIVCFSTARGHYRVGIPASPVIQALSGFCLGVLGVWMVGSLDGSRIWCLTTFVVIYAATQARAVLRIARPLFSIGGFWAARLRPQSGGFPGTGFDGS